MMSVMSILSCKMLQDEIIWLVANDFQIKKVLIVANMNISDRINFH